jgi:hypothetical protein
MDMEISLGQAGEPLEVQFIFYVDAVKLKTFSSVLQILWISGP